MKQNIVRYCDHRILKMYVYTRYCITKQLLHCLTSGHTVLQYTCTVIVLILTSRGKYHCIYIYIYVPIRPYICRFNMTTFSSVSMQGFCFKKRPTSLQDHLIGARYSKYDETMFMSDSCNRYRCSHCKSINRGSELWSSITGNNYILRIDIMCATKSLIYLITCKRCDTQHVCQTTQPVSVIITVLIFQTLWTLMCSSLVAPYFNSVAHVAACR